MVALNHWVGKELRRQPLQVRRPKLPPQKIEIAHPDTANLVEAQLSDLSEQVGHPSVRHVGSPIDFDAIFHGLFSLQFPTDDGTRPACQRAVRHSAGMVL